MIGTLDLPVKRLNHLLNGAKTDPRPLSSVGTSTTIPAGAASRTIIVTPVDDTAVEGSEDVTVSLATSSAYTLGNPSSAAVNISDNDVNPPTVSISATDPSAAEAGSDTGTFTITRTGGTSTSLAVNFSVTGNATSGNDYSAVGTSTTIPVGAASHTITITPVDDSAVESPENVIVTLATNSAYTVGSPSSATVNITDNDFPPTVSLTAPVAGTVVTAPGNLTLTALPDQDGTIAKVAFYQNGTQHN